MAFVSFFVMALVDTCGPTPVEGPLQAKWTPVYQQGIEADKSLSIESTVSQINEVEILASSASTSCKGLRPRRNEGNICSETTAGTFVESFHNQKGARTVGRTVPFCHIMAHHGVHRNGMAKTCTCHLAKALVRKYSFSVYQCTFRPRFQTDNK